MLFHTSVRTLAQDFLTQLQRHYYATPTSYLELISTYKHLLAAKRTQVYTLKHRYCPCTLHPTQPKHKCLHRRLRSGSSARHHGCTKQKHRQSLYDRLMSMMCSL